MNSKHLTPLYDSHELIKAGRHSTLSKGTWCGQPATIRIFPNDENSQLYMVKTREAYKSLGNGIASDYATKFYIADDTDNQVVVIVSPYGQNLSKIIDNKIKLSRSAKMEIVLEMCRAFGYLEEKGIVHGNGKPSKILITKDGRSGKYHVKLTEFGVSHIFHDECNKWMPPEVMHAVNKGDSEVEATSAGDVYRLGLLIFYVFTNGKFLYGEKPSFQNYNAQHNNPQFGSISKSYPILKYLIQAMTQTDPKMRPSIDDVINVLQFLSYRFCYNFIKKVHKIAKNRNWLQRDINRLSLLGPSWDSRLDRRWFKKRVKNTKFYSVFRLLAFIRNKFEHENELPKKIRQLISNKKGVVRKASHMRYFLNKIPDLISVLAASDCVGDLKLPSKIMRALKSFRYIQI